MQSLAYSGLEESIRPEIPAAQRAFWEALGKPGAWWTGDERIAIAQRAREARAVRSDPPWMRANPTEEDPAAARDLPKVAETIARRIAIEASQLTREECQAAAAELGDAAYVELVSIVVCLTAIDAYAEALGCEFEPFPDAEPGEPTRIRPEGMGDAGAWVDMLAPFSGPNVARALSLAPADHMRFLQLVGAMYSLTDFADLVWKDRALSRPQVELVASRVSAVNECFY